MFKVFAGMKFAEVYRANPLLAVNAVIICNKETVSPE
jgi:hypothetical protein